MYQISPIKIGSLAAGVAIAAYVLLRAIEEALGFGVTMGAGAVLFGVSLYGLTVI